MPSASATASCCSRTAGSVASARSTSFARRPGLPSARIGGCLPCAHLTQSRVHRAPLRPLLAKELWDVVSGRALWTMLLILCPLVGYSFFQAVSLYGEASAAARDRRRLQRAVAARRRAGADLRRVLPGRHAAVPVRGHPRPRTRKGNRRAAPAGAAALPGADADRREDGGIVRRLADRDRSGALGLGRSGPRSADTCMSRRPPISCSAICSTACWWERSRCLRPASPKARRPPRSSPWPSRSAPGSWISRWPGSRACSNGLRGCR